MCWVMNSEDDLPRIHVYPTGRVLEAEGEQPGHYLSVECWCEPESDQEWGVDILRHRAVAVH